MISGALGIFGRVAGVCCYDGKGKFSAIMTIWATANLTILAILVSVAEYQNIHVVVKPARKALGLSLLFTDVAITIVHHFVQISKRHLFEEIFFFTQKTKNTLYDYVVVFVAAAVYAILLADPWDTNGLVLTRFFQSLGRNRLIFANTYHFLVSIIIFQFCSIVSRVSFRLKMTRFLLEQTEVAIHHHSKLTYLAKTANRLWNFQLLLICFHIFGYTVLLIYDTVRPLLDDPGKSIQDVLLIVVALILIGIELFCLANSCHQTMYNVSDAHKYISAITLLYHP